MEAKKRDYYQTEYYRTTYVEGNTVRKLSAVPDFQREERQVELPSRRRQEQNQPKALSGINLASLLVLIVAISVTVFVCFEYLSLQTDVTQLGKQAEKSQQTLTALTKENDATMDKLNAAVDMDKIYKTAVQEYGMVYPNKNTIISFKSSDDSFVRQYEDIPQ
jgi:hypothetical protein